MSVPDMAFWTVVGLIAALEGAIIVTALRMRVAEHPERGILGRRPAEVLWTLLPALLLAVLIAYSFGTGL